MRLIFCLILLLVGLCKIWATLTTDYCIVGAGPGGLQMGYFMKENGWDYKIFEKESIPGSFFTKYPRHRKLISINKRHTGATSPEVKLRHDWNSLLSNNENLLFTKYSEDYFPHADTMVKYLKDYAEENQLNIMYNKEVEQVVYNDGRNAAECSFELHIKGVVEKQCCKTLVMASGMAHLKQLDMTGRQYVETYDTLSTNPNDYAGKSVLIIGKGNSAFETATSIYTVTNHVHMVSRNRLRMSWETHYTGDLRAVNNEVLDAYQLKSLDTLIDADASKFKITKESDGLLYVTSNEGNLTTRDSSPMRQGYDKIIECAGFQWDECIFQGGHPSAKYPENTYPLVKPDFESKKYPGLYFAGNLAHSLDYRKSSGGFIHGMRYTVKALSKILARKNDNKPWSSVEYPMDELKNHLLVRASESSGIYQMYGYLCDVAVLDKTSNMFKYYEEFPVKNMNNFAYYAGINENEELKKQPSVVLCMDYGRNFSGPGMDVFGPDRVVTSPDNSHNSKYLHPWIYFFNHVPKCLKEAMYIHHVLEDSTYTFDGPISHIKPLETVLNKFLSGTTLRKIKTDL